MPQPTLMPWERDPKLVAMQPQAPRIPWRKFIDSLVWMPGEHVALVGPTGSGKTVLLSELVGIRTYGVVFATKPQDNSMEELIDVQGFVKYPSWPRGLDPDKHPRRIVWPDARTLGAPKTQAPIFAEAFEEIYVEGGWNLFVDEGWFVTQMLGLGEHIKMYLLQARSLNISLIIATQRPVSVPTEVWDQSTHLFFFKENDERNLDRIGGISWKSAFAVKQMIASLEAHQFLYINTRTGDMVRSRVPYRPPYVPPQKGFLEKHFKR